MLTRIKLTCSVAFIGLSSACSLIPGSHIDTVRNGTLNQYKSTTIAKAFESTFQHCDWRSFTGPKGESVVEFTGTATAKTLAEGYIDVPEPETCGGEFKAWNQETHNYLSIRASMFEEREHENRINELRTRMDQCEESTPVPIEIQFLMSAANSNDFEIIAATLAGRPIGYVRLLNIAYQ